MKKILLYTAAIVALFVAVSCDREEVNEPAFNGQAGVNLSLWCLSSDTKSDISDFSGVEKYNENKISDFYYFVYSGNNGTSNEFFSAEYCEGESYVAVMDDYQVAKGNTGYIFVVANPTEGLKTSIEALLANDGKPSVSDITSLEVESDLKTLSTKEFEAPANFVMISKDSGLTEFNLVKGKAVDVSVEMSRVAAKVSIDIKIADWYTQYASGNNDTYEGTWYPDIDNMDVYMMYVTGKGKLDGTPTSYTDADYWSYYRWGWTDRAKQSTTYEDKFPSYNEDGTVTYESFTVTGNEVKGSPFYTYPTTWNSDDANAPFIKVILPWDEYKENTKPESVIADMKTQTKGTKDEWVTWKEFFYKINLPKGVLTLESNHWYHITLELSVLGGETDEAEVTITGTYYVEDWSNPGDPIGGELNAGRFLNTAKSQYEMYDNYVEIPVISSHDLSISGTPTGTYEVYRGNDNGRLTYVATNPDATPDQNSYTNKNFTIVPVGNSAIRIYHKVVSDLGEVGSKDVAPITYSFTISHSDDAAYYKNIKVVQYPAIYAESVLTQNSSTVWLYGTQYSGRATPVSNDNSEGLGNIGNSTSGDYKAIVTISTLANIDVNPYLAQGIGAPVIGDPRISLDAAYPVKPGSTERWDANDFRNIPTNYMYADPNKQNVIAPKIMIASGYGGNNVGQSDTKIDWVHTAQRCASYQEDGYPAGRWRIPTEAEILFIYLLAQERQVIQNPFYSTTNRYWGNAGRFIYRGQFNTNNTTASSRCVYDLWYWGDDKLSNPVDWGGFETDYINNN